jgi:hypothetical protein
VGDRKLIRESSDLDQAAIICHPAVKDFVVSIQDEDAAFCRYVDVKKLRASCASAVGDVWRVGSAWRSFAAQDDLLARSKATGSNVTYVGGGDSYHNWGLAVDLVFTRTGFGDALYDGRSYPAADVARLYQDCGLVAYAAAKGFRWEAWDASHFEWGVLPLKSMRLQKFASSPLWWQDRAMYASEADWRRNQYEEQGIVSIVAGDVAAAAGRSFGGVGRLALVGVGCYALYKAYKVFAKKGS